MKKSDADETGADLRAGQAIPAAISDVERTPLVIVGAGRQGRNTAGVIEADARYSIAAFLDEAPAGPVLGVPVHGLNDYEGPVWNAMLAVGDGRQRADLILRQGGKPFRWLTYVHPWTHVSSHASIGEGCVLAPFAFVGAARVGAYSLVQAHAVIGSGAEVGDFCSLLIGVVVAPDARVGARTCLSSGVVVEAGVSIGADCVVGPNTVVRHDLPDGTLLSTPLRQARRSLAPKRDRS